MKRLPKISPCFFCYEETFEWIEKEYVAPYIDYPTENDYETLYAIKCCAEDCGYQSSYHYEKTEVIDAHNFIYEAVEFYDKSIEVLVKNENTPIDSK